MHSNKLADSFPIERSVWYLWEGLEARQILLATSEVSLTFALSNEIVIENWFIFLDVFRGCPTFRFFFSPSFFFLLFLIPSRPIFLSILSFLLFPVPMRNAPLREINIPGGANIWGELCVAHGGGNVSSGSRWREILMRTFSAETYTSRSCKVSQMLASMHFVCSVASLFFVATGFMRRVFAEGIE